MTHGSFWKILLTLFQRQSTLQRCLLIVQGTATERDAVIASGLLDIELPTGYEASAMAIRHFLCFYTSAQSRKLDANSDVMM